MNLTEMILHGTVRTDRTGTRIFNVVVRSTRQAAVVEEEVQPPQWEIQPPQGEIQPAQWQIQPARWEIQPPQLEIQLPL